MKVQVPGRASLSELPLTGIVAEMFYAIARAYTMPQRRSLSRGQNGRGNTASVTADSSTNSLQNDAARVSCSNIFSTNKNPEQQPDRPRMLFKCELRFKEKRALKSNSIFVADHQVCTDCFYDHVVEQFWESIRNPSIEFPFRYGNTAVRFQDYARHIRGYQSMLRAYDNKKDELETPRHLRVYCDREVMLLGPKKRR